MTLTIADDDEQLVKSAERVRDLGEVFTPASIVQAMLDLLPDDVWEPHPSRTFLEPAAGDGNYLVAILERKLAAVVAASDAGTLPAGRGTAAVEFHALEALASIYAVDVSPDNVIGGTPGHEIGARDRLLRVFATWLAQVVEPALPDRSVLLQSARWIVDRNVLVGNMLPSNFDGTPSGRDFLPLVEYRWESATTNVEVLTTTLGSVMVVAQAERSESPTLLGLMEEPTVVWSGAASDLRDAPVPAPTVPKSLLRHRNTRR